jgi:hypothetical protein
VPVILGLKIAREGNDSVETVARHRHLRRPVHDGGSADEYIPTLGGKANEAAKQVLLVSKRKTRCPANREVGVDRFHEHRAPPARAEYLLKQPQVNLRVGGGHVHRTVAKQSLISSSGTP